PSITRLTPARTWSRPIDSSLACSPYRIGSGAASCCSRSLSRLLLGISPGVALRAVAERSPASETSCARAKGTVSPINAEGKPDGATKNPLAGTYLTRKSTGARFGDDVSPRLTNNRLTSCPLIIATSRFVSLGFVETAFTKTSLGSCSECSTRNSDRSPTTMELTVAGKWMVVTNLAATSTTVTFPSRSVLVRICGSTCGSCADAAPVDKTKPKRQSARNVLIYHPKVDARSCGRQLSAQSRAA